MNLMIAAICCTLGVPTLATAADAVSQETKDFLVADSVGRCLVMNCRVFRGVALNGDPKPGAPVAMRVDEWMHGQRPPGDTIDVPYVDQYRKEGVGGAPGAWGRVGFRVPTDVALTVVLNLENTLSGPAGEPVLVTFDSHENDLIRRLLDLDQSFRTNPGLVRGAVASLSTTVNPGMAGYLLAFLTEAHPNNPTSVTWELLFQMLDSPGVPPEGRQAIPIYLVTFSGGAPPGGRERMIRRFIDLGLSDDTHSVQVGFEGLAIVIGQSGESVLNSISPAERNRLITAYRTMIAGRKGGNKWLEAALGVR
jgi:hypothetical protein